MLTTTGNGTTIITKPLQVKFNKRPEFCRRIEKEQGGDVKETRDARRRRINKTVKVGGQNVIGEKN